MAKSKIIRDLANGEVDTITALKRAKVLVSDLNNDEISEWLDYEISGYPTEAIIPSYRKVHGSLMGSYFKGSMASHMTWKNVSIPLGKMPSDTQRKLHFPCAGFASYPFVDLPPMNDCKQSFTVSKFYTFPI